ncbi:MAG: hydroxyisourate hydrolase [Chitinophagaceae bacterium]
MSQITTHILDTMRGRPAAGVRVVFYYGENDEWTEIGRSETNEDGRAKDLVADGKTLQPGIYKLRLETKDYFDADRITTFYPYVEIVFEISSSEHYHVPLLLSPFGYSTYRGS